MASWLYSTCNTFALKISGYRWVCILNCERVEGTPYDTFWVRTCGGTTTRASGYVIEILVSGPIWRRHQFLTRRGLLPIFGATNLLLVRVGGGGGLVPNFPSFSLSCPFLQSTTSGSTKRGSKSYDYVLTIWTNIYDTMLLVCPSVPGYSSILPTSVLPAAHLNSWSLIYSIQEVQWYLKISKWDADLWLGREEILKLVTKVMGNLLTCAHRFPEEY